MDNKARAGLAIAAGAAAIGGGLLLWRRGGNLLVQDEHHTDPKKLGFAVTTERSDRLIREVGMHFLSGFNTMMTCRRVADFDRFGDQVYPLYRPFFYEGGALGYFPKRYFAFWTSDQFERRVVARRPAFAPNAYLGAGLWYAYRCPRNPYRIAEQLALFDPVYRHLAYDGYGFKLGYYDFVRRPRVIERFDLFDEETRRLCYQGLGRAFRFVYADAPERLVETIGAIDEVWHDDCWIGWGHGIGQTGVEDFTETFDAVSSVPERHQTAFRLGLIMAVWMRRTNDADYLDRRLGEFAGPWRHFTDEGLAACDDAHARVRTDLRSHELFGENPLLAWQRLTRERLEPAQTNGGEMPTFSDSN